MWLALWLYQPRSWPWNSFEGLEEPVMSVLWHTPPSLNEMSRRCKQTGKAEGASGPCPEGLNSTLAS